MTDIYERLADENEPAPATAPAAQPALPVGLHRAGNDVAVGVLEPA